MFIGGKWGEKEEVSHLRGRLDIHVCFLKAFCIMVSDFMYLLSFTSHCSLKHGEYGNKWKLFSFTLFIILLSVDIPLINSCWQFWYISFWQYCSVQLDADNLWNRSDKILSNSSKEIKSEVNTSLHPSLLDLKWMHAVYTGKPYFFYYPSATHCGGYIDALWSVCQSVCPPVCHA